MGAGKDLEAANYQGKRLSEGQAAHAEAAPMPRIVCPHCSAICYSAASVTDLRKPVCPACGEDLRTGQGSQAADETVPPAPASNHAGENRGT